MPRRLLPITLLLAGCAGAAGSPSASLVIHGPTWTGDPELGECAPIECVSCEILGMEQCVETPTCEWLVGKEICAA